MSGSGFARRGNRTRGVATAARSPSPWLAIPPLIAIIGLIGLGVWQIERRSWKLALIERVEQRIHAAPVPIPSASAWPAITAASDEYRHVAVTGTFLKDRETLAKAVTDQGGGYWVITPLRTGDGTIVLINRGFVPQERSDPSARDGGSQGRIDVTGLLRITEPKGGFLRDNDPAHERWYSRDVAAIAEARGLSEVAPFFIDADATPDRGGLPVAGLTVVRFPNNHLIYALTWFGLASMLAGRFLFTLGGGPFRRRRFVREPVSEAHAAARGTGSDAGTIVEPT